MEMLLMLLCWSLFAAAISAIGFKASVGPEPQAKTEQPVLPVLKVAPERFFSDRVVPNIPAHAQVPIELLIQQIENHVRLEEAAAESFVQFPTDTLLHTKTQSPLVN